MRALKKPTWDKDIDFAICKFRVLIGNMAKSMSKASN